MIWVIYATLTVVTPNDTTAYGERIGTLSYSSRAECEASITDEMVGHHIRFKLPAGSMYTLTDPVCQPTGPNSRD